MKATQILPLCLSITLSVPLLVQAKNHHHRHHHRQAKQSDQTAISTTTVQEVNITHSQAYMDSVKKYPVCNVAELGQKLASGENIYKTSFPTRHITDQVANYDFYAITENSQLNADRIRGATCKYIMDNKCRVFWGNILNMAYIAERPTASFPLDTTPHYVISPEITCHKINFNAIENGQTPKNPQGLTKAMDSTGFQIKLT